jgi:membrane protease YdiL (CAAX protease family)
LNPTAGRSPWRRYLSFAAIVLLFLLWYLIAEPIIAFALGLTTELEAGLVLRGMLALLLAIGFTIRGTWRANGFGGGLRLRWWRALWPVWLVAVPMLALYAGQRSAKEHVLTFALCIFVGFTEEAIFRGIMLRNLLPGGTRSAILWSAVWFGALHLTGALVGFDGRMVLLTAASAFAVGLIFAWARIASASIWPVVIAHSFFDYGALIESGGGLRQAMRYSTQDAVLSALFTILLLAWAWRLMFHEAWSSHRAADALDDLRREPA